MKPSKFRLISLAGILLVVFAAMFVRLEYMVQVKGETYTQRAEGRTTKDITLYGMRGTIYDSNMVPLAYDRTSYNVTFYRDPTRSSEEDRRTYTQTLIEVIKLVESNGKSTVNDFWLKKDEQGVWRFNSGASSEKSEEIRERQWRSNFYLSTTEEEKLWDSLLEKYCIPKDLDEDMAVKVLALWQESRMNAFNSTPVPIAYDVGFETVSEIEVRSMDLLGIDIQESSSRVYPQGSTACHVTGYISKISANQLDTYQSQGYPNNAFIGSDGIERYLEDQLSPYIEYRQGTRSVEVDTRGKVVRELGYEAPTDGNSVVLTIDVDLQNVMAKALDKTIKSINARQKDTVSSARWKRHNEEELKEYRKNDWSISYAETGAMVAMDPYTGKVLGMVSLPDYDLSVFDGGQVDLGTWNEILEGNNPLLNRAIGTKDAPGSIFKMVTALGALSEGELGLTETIDDKGGFYKTNQTNPAKCWTSYPENHQNQTIVEGLKNSCNYFFYECGYRLGIQKLYQWSAALGLTSKTNIELPGEATSFVGNQDMLYDPNYDVNWQNTAKPLLTYQSIEKKLLQIAEARSEEYSAEQLEKAIEDLMLIAVSHEQKSDWYAPIREVLMYDLGLPASYISGNYLVNTFVSYLADIFWTPNETIMVAIGQSITQVTPVAVARYVSAIVNGGTVYDAQIVDKIIAPDGTVVLEKEPVVANQIVTDNAFYAAIREGMEEVTDEVAGGTASDYFKDAKFKTAAKTGTSQRTILDVENNSWLVAYAPANDPKIVVVCYIQNGYSGAYSAEAVVPVINYYLSNVDNKEKTVMTSEYSMAD